MEVREIMTTPALSCRPETDLAAAAGLMWRGNCGILPVVDDRDQVVGVITDRDICIAVGTRHRLAAHIAVREAMSMDVQVCRPDDEVKTALATMKTNRVRRLPVVDADGRLAGVLSFDDVVRVSGRGRGRPTQADIVNALRFIGSGRPSEAE